MIVVSAFFTRLFSFGSARAIVIFPFIFLENHRLKHDPMLLNHERIHWKQILELLVVGFYLCYLLEFLFRFVQYRNKHKAYLNISFEREAYRHEHDLRYLERREMWSWWKYR